MNFQPIVRKFVHPIWLLTIYPVWFMFPTLLPGTNSMLQYSGVLDTSGTVEVTQALQRMKYPWSLNVMANAPFGESFWNLARLVQSIQWLVLWFLTRFNSAILSVNLFICLGWVLSGISVYVLCRYLRLSIFSSTVSGLLIQMLPWVREKAMTHVAYVYLCIPIFAILLLLKTKDMPNWRNFLNLIGFLMFTVFFDLYWFYIDIFIAAIFLLVSYRPILSKLQRYSLRVRVVLALLSLLIVGFLIQVYGFLQRRTLSGVSLHRPFSVSSDGLIDIFNGSLFRFVRPTVGHLLVENGVLRPQIFVEDYVIYGGLVSVLLAIGSVIVWSKFEIAERGSVYILAAIAGFCALVTIPTQVITPLGVVPSPAHFLKFVTPGMRVFSRFGLVTEALICVLAGCMFEVLRKLNLRKLYRYSIIVLLLVACALDTYPFSRRFINSEYVGYAKVRQILNSNEQPVLLKLAPPLDKLYFAASYSDSPQLSTNNNKYWDYGLWRSAELGDHTFASYLSGRRVTHVLVPINADGTTSYRRKFGIRPSINLTFPTHLFREVARVGGNSPAALFELITPLNSVGCTDCFDIELQWNNVRQTFYTHGYFNGRPYYEDGYLSWVYPNEEPVFKFFDNKQGHSNFEVRLFLVAAFGANAQTQLIQVNTKDEKQTYKLTAGPALEVVITVAEDSPVKLRSFLPCTVPSIHEPGNPDTRKLCYGISDLEVIEVVSSSN